MSRQTTKSFRDLLGLPLQSEDFSFESEPEATEIIEGLALVESLHPNQTILLCNRSHPQLRYVSANCENTMGLKPDALFSLSPLQFFSLIYPEDQPTVKSCFDHMLSLQPFNPFELRFVLKYRFNQGHRSYAWIQDEKLVIKSREGKAIFFSILSNTESDDAYSGMKVFRIVNGHTIAQYWYTPNDPTEVVTARQKQIVGLLRQGFSTKEIAATLRVSPNTVRNHKHILFKRANVRSSIDLLRYFDKISG
jgi:DNA-binding CsgD family transcriptional regulator